jgi:Helix-turn-helix domain of resolvase
MKKGLISQTKPLVHNVPTGQVGIGLQVIWFIKRFDQYLIHLYSQIKWAGKKIESIKWVETYRIVAIKVGSKLPLIAGWGNYKIKPLQVGGRKRKMTTSKMESAKKLLAAGTVPKDVAKNLGISIPTLYRWIPASSIWNPDFWQFFHRTRTGFSLNLM